MRKLTLILAVVAIMVSTKIFAQDKIVFSQIEGIQEVFNKSLKWDEFKIPAFFEDKYILWDDYLKLEGKAKNRRVEIVEQ